MAAPRTALRPRGRRLTPLVVAALVVVLLGSAALAVVEGTRLAARHATQARDEALLAAARQSAVDFTTLDYRHLDRDLARVTGGAAGDFKQQFSAQLASLRDLVTKNKAVSTGHVLDAGIVTADDDSGRVLVVADSDVTNTAEPKGARRHYRLQLDLVRHGGRWLTSGLEFVG